MTGEGDLWQMKEEEGWDIETGSLLRKRIFFIHLKTVTSGWLWTVEII